MPSVTSTTEEEPEPPADGRRAGFGFCLGDGALLLLEKNGIGQIKRRLEELGGELAP